MKHIVLIDTLGMVLTLNSELNAKTIFEIETKNVTSVWTPMSQFYVTTLTTVGVVKPFMEATDEVWCEGGVVRFVKGQTDYGKQMYLLVSSDEGEIYIFET